MENYLMVFIAVIEEQSFTKAADLLHMTQPAVSQTVQNLEKKLGVTLIERGHKTFYLNQAGKIVYSYAKEITAKYEHMEHLVSELKDEASGDLVIGASFTIGEYIVPGLMKPLHETYPSIQPHVLIGNTQMIVDKLINHDIDIGLVEGVVDDFRLSSQTFMVDEMYMIAGNRKELTTEHITSISDLAAYTWLIREEGSGTRRLTENLLQQYDIQPKQIYTFGSTQIIKEAIESGLGISLLSTSTIKKELQLGTVKTLPVQETPIKRNFSILKRQQTFQTKTIKVFEALLHHYY